MSKEEMNTSYNNLYKLTNDSAVEIEETIKGEEEPTEII